MLSSPHMITCTYTQTYSTHTQGLPICGSNKLSWKILEMSGNEEDYTACINLWPELQNRNVRKLSLQENLWNLKPTNSVATTRIIPLLLNSSRGYILHWGLIFRASKMPGFVSTLGSVFHKGISTQHVRGPPRCLLLEWPAHSMCPHYTEVFNAPVHTSASYLRLGRTQYTITINIYLDLVAIAKILNKWHNPRSHLQAWITVLKL